MIISIIMVAIVITLLTFVNEVQAVETNLARNEDRIGYPVLSASYTCCSDNPWHTVDGVFSLDRWTNYGGHATDWVAIDFGTATTFNQVKLYLYNDGGGVQPPSSYNVQYYNGAAWVNTTNQFKTPENPTGALSSTAAEADTLNIVNFDTVVANQLRVVFTNGNNYVGIVELEVFDAPIPPGDGTSERPYRMSTANHLQYMSNHLSANYVLTSDINLTGVSWTPIGLDSSSPFNGTLDGHGYTINNLTIASGSNNVGLFGVIGAEGKVKNLRIDGAVVTGNTYVGVLAGHNQGDIADVYITNANVNGSENVGGLVGYHYANGSVDSTIMNSTVSGAVYGHGYVGGLIGLGNKPVLDSSTAVTVNVVGGYGGGLVGYILNASITNSYATGNVTGNYDIGGLIGYFQQSTLHNSYGSGVANGETNLVGYNDGSTMTSSSWVPHIVNFNGNGGSTVNIQGLNSNEVVTRPSDPLKTQHTFLGWYADAALSNLYSFTEPVTAHTTLYAKWIPTYTVSFDSNDGSAVANQTVDNNELATEPIAPTKTGYRFDGWYSDEALGNAYSFATPVTEDITLYAKWVLTNLALNKPVITGTGGFCGAGETPAQAVDGLTGTKWCYAGSDWLRIDLGDFYHVSQFILTNNSENASYKAKDYKIDISLDGIIWTNVVDVTNNSTVVATHNINPIMARYVKLDVISPEQGVGGKVRINEFEVIGDPTAVVNAAIPSILSHPTGVTVTEGAVSPVLSVESSLSDGGTLSYQWYSNSTNSNSGGDAIIGATSSSYTAPTDEPGMMYYYAEVTNTNSSVTGSQWATATSNVAQVNVIEIPTGSLIIANGASAVHTTTVNLTLTRSSNDASQMRFSDDGMAWSDWENYSDNKSYTMPSGDGEKIIYMELLNTAANIISITISDSIILDTIAPDAPVMSHSPTEPTQLVTVTIDYPQDAVIRQYQQWGDNRSSYTGPFTMTANRNITAYAIDEAGNESQSTISITNIDTTAPNVSAMINNSSIFAMSEAIEITLDDNGTGATMMRFSDDNMTWTEWEPYSETRPYALPVGDGLKTIYMQFHDFFENIGAVISETITPDTTEPSGTVVMNNGSTLTNEDVVTLTLDDGGSGATQIQFSHDNEVWTIWENYNTTMMYSLISGDGLNTVHVKLKDAAGNESTSFHATINLDMTAPVTTDNITINNTTKYVTINLSASDNGTDIETIYYTVDGVEGTGNLIFLNKQGAHHITYWSVDAAGNIESVHSKVVKVEILQMDSNGQFHIGHIVELIREGTLLQQDMNGDGIFDSEDIEIMLNAVTPIHSYNGWEELLE